MNTSFVNWIKKNPGICVCIVILIVAVIFPFIFKSPYYQDVAISSMCSAVLGIGFLIGHRAGLINMTLPVFWGIGGYASAILVRETGMSTWAALPLSILFALVVALGLGYLLISSGSSGFAFVMLTQIVCMMFPTLLSNVRWLGGSTGFSTVPISSIFGINFENNKFAVYYVTLIMLFIVVIVAWCFYSAWSGRAWSAIGMNARLADSIGINRFRYKLMAYVVASVLVAFCGCIYVHYRQYVYPTNYTMWKNVYIQIYAIMGGTNFSLAGPITGGVVMSILPEIFRFTDTLEPLVDGIILILIIQYMPKGLLGAGRQMLDFFKKGNRKSGVGRQMAEQVAGSGSDPNTGSSTGQTAMEQSVEWKEDQDGKDS